MEMNLFGEEVVQEVVEEYKRPAAPPLFDWLNSITKSKNDLREVDSDLRGYDPFIINKGLMQSESTIQFANIMNRMPEVPKEYQYMFYMRAIPAHRNFAKWAKIDKVDNLTEVMEKTGYTRAKALEVIRVLTKDQVKQLITSGGGIKTKSRKKN